MSKKGYVSLAAGAILALSAIFRGVGAEGPAKTLEAVTEGQLEAVVDLITAVAGAVWAGLAALKVAYERRKKA